MKITNGRREVSYFHMPPRVPYSQQLESLGMTATTPDGLTWKELDKSSSRAYLFGPPREGNGNSWIPPRITAVCEECDRTYEVAATARHARFCGATCRQRAHRREKRDGAQVLSAMRR